MNAHTVVRSLFPGQLAVLLLASAIAVPVVAQQAQPAGEPQSTPPVAAQPSPSASSASTDKEGFWGHLNPFARKKWVHKRIDPLNDRLTELDEVNAKNSKDIQDVDSRAQAGIHHAQSTADAANETATAAGAKARNAHGIAEGAAGHVDQLNSTVNGLDKYHQITDADVAFRTGSPVLSATARKQLDDLAASLTGHQGYIVELEAHAPGAGSVGIQHSQRLAEAVERYLVTEHEIPVYRMHFVALGNAPVAASGGEPAAPIRHSSVHVRLMENSLAAQDSTPPHGVASATGAERP